MTDYKREYYEANKDRVKDNAKKWGKANVERRRQIGRDFYKRRMLEDPSYYRRKARKLYWKNPDKFRKRAKYDRDKLRGEFILEYGNKCGCCGEPEHAFLTLEHKNRDGKAHRESVASGYTSTGVLRDLKQRGWPKDNYELLCFNCNRASWVLGICPHRLKGEADNGTS